MNVYLIFCSLCFKIETFSIGMKYFQSIVSYMYILYIFCSICCKRQVCVGVVIKMSNNSMKPWTKFHIDICSSRFNVKFNGMWMLIFLRFFCVIFFLMCFVFEVQSSVEKKQSICSVRKKCGTSLHLRVFSRMDDKITTIDR